MIDILQEVHNDIAQMDEDFLKSIPLPMETKSYSPVSHGMIIDTVQNHLRNNGYRIKQKSYNHAKNGQQLIGQYAIDNGDPDMGMMIAFRNSYDKSMSLGFCTGAQVWICGNGMLSGEIAYKRKHTGDAPHEILSVMGQSLDYIDYKFKTLQEDRGTMIDHNAISKRAAAELLGRMVIEEEIINTMQLNIIRREMEMSKDFKFNGSIWNLYNNCTEALKKSHPTNYINDHVDLHNFFMHDVMA